MGEPCTNFALPPKMSSSPASIKGPVKYGELIVLGYNDLLSNGDEARTKSPFTLYQRPKANGVKPNTVHMGCPQAISKDQDQFCTVYVNQVDTVAVEYALDKSTDMFQIGRSTESPIDFVVTDIKDTISRFACRIICQRSPPYAARIYGAAFDSSKNIFLGEKALKWARGNDGQMDGLTTNGVLVMHPLHGFTQDSKPGLWREISVCGDTYTLRETQQRQGKKVHNESQELVDGSLIYLCGVTLLWRTAEGLARMPTIEALEDQCKKLLSVEQRVVFIDLPFPSLRRKEVPLAYQCGHIHDFHGWRDRTEPEVEAKGQEGQCPSSHCGVRGPYVPLQLGYEMGFYLDAAPLNHAFVPCGHVCSEKTATFWSQMTLPHEGTDSCHAVCPFCVQQLTGHTGYIRLHELRGCIRDTFNLLEGPPFFGDRQVCIRPRNTQL